MGGPRNPYYKTPTYTVWDSMLQRCTNPKQTHYKNYGGRGILVCKEWLKFSNFICDMGVRPKGMVLDRINNSLGYKKENCRWTDRKTQQRNMRTNRLLTYNGKTQCLSAWAEEKKLPYGRLSTRIQRGWSVERALK